MVRWRVGDPYPELDEWISFDHETELISVKALIPPLVVAGFYVPSRQVAYVVDHESSAAFYEHVYKSNTKMYGFFSAYDISTAETPWAEKLLFESRVMCTQQNLNMHWLATRGKFRYDCQDLEGACANLFQLTLDKEKDAGDAAARLSFHRGVEPTDKQLAYLAGDIVGTYLCGTYCKPYPTWDLQSMSSYILYRMTYNGAPVDVKVHRYYQERLREEMEIAAEKLRLLGYPLKEKKSNVEKSIIRIERDVKKLGCTGLTESLSGRRNAQVRAIVELTKYAIDSTDMFHSAGDAPNADVLERIKILGDDPLGPDEEDLYYGFMEAADLGAFAARGKKDILLIVLAEIIHCVLIKKNTDGMIDHMITWGDENAGLLDSTEGKGSQKFFQNHLINLMNQNPGLVFPKTKSGKSWSFTKSDKYLLEDAGVSSPFLEAYADYRHYEKYLGTYLNPAAVFPDGKIRPRFKNLVRSGRSASGGNHKLRDENNVEIEIPGINGQNFPSRDKKWKLKNIVCAPEGWAVVMVDYSAIETAAWAQHCWTKYRCSRMRELNLAGICPHYWFAGVSKGIISPKELRFDKQYCDELTAFLEANVTDAERNQAKVPNFGLPGGLGVNTLYRQMRSFGYSVTKDYVGGLIEKWKSVFFEIKQHLNPQVMPGARIESFRDYGFYDDQDEDDDDDAEEFVADVSADDRSGRYVYMTETLTGRLRVACSFNAACNTPFQGLASDGGKYGLVEMYKLGLKNYMFNYVHDEFDMFLPLTSIKTAVPRIEAAAVRGMKKVLPDVVVKVESTINRYWDKGGVKFKKAEFDKRGKLILPADPEYIQQIYTGSHT